MEVQLQCSIETAGFRLESLTKEDLEEFFTFVEKFIEFSIQMNNGATVKITQEEQSLREVKDGTLYEYHHRFDGDTRVRTDEVEHTYKPGDVISIYTSEKIKDTWEFNNVVIQSIEENGLYKGLRLKPPML